MEQDGWPQAVQRGSHRHFRHPDEAGPSKELTRGPLESILRQSGLSKEVR
ncbi:MAG: type II toxin-antitoxin system HicA family toxin [Acidimicrobiales bacterium]